MDIKLFALYTEDDGILIYASAQEAADAVERLNEQGANGITEVSENIIDTLHFEVVPQPKKAKVKNALSKEEKYAMRKVSLGLDNKPCGGLQHFSGLTGYVARQLIEAGAANVEDAQNDAPTFGAIVTFLEDNPKFTGHGYVVLPSRDDERITLEGVESSCVLSAEERKAFKAVFGKADEFSNKQGNFRAWYD